MVTGELLTQVSWTPGCLVRAGLCGQSFDGASEVFECEKIGKDVTLTSSRLSLSLSAPAVLWDSILSPLN